MRIEIQWNSLFPLSMPYVTTLQYREIFWQNGSLLYGSDTAKQEFFMRLQLRLQSLHKHDFISNQLLFYCWLTQQHINFNVSFSFNSSSTCLHIIFSWHLKQDSIQTDPFMCMKWLANKKFEEKLKLYNMLISVHFDWDFWNVKCLETKLWLLLVRKFLYYHHNHPDETLS